MDSKVAIHFGTSGWRAVIADEFTFANVRRVTEAIVKYLQDHHLEKKGLIVGYDTRFLSKEFARHAAQCIAGHNIKVFLTGRDAPTPVIAYQILKKKTAGAINITASHNPPEYNGIKFSPAYGGPAPAEVTKEIERKIKRRFVARPKSLKTIHLFDPRPAYCRQIRQLVNFKVIRRAHLRIGVDVLHGSGRDYLDRLLCEAGCRVSLLHQNLDPLFGGLSPEPAAIQLKELTALIKKKHLHLGLAVDGDADRFGVVDRDGTYINANQVIGLLTEHLILTRPRQKRLARTVATTHLVDALAQRNGLEVVETPVGFKYIGQELAKADCLIGAEESGGLSIAGHVPEKDGILACLLVAELVATRKQSLGEILQQLYRKVGPFLNSRTDFSLDEKEQAQFVRTIKSFARRQSLLGKKVVQFKGFDGYKFIFTDGSWLMFRASGTEPLIRCYCEAGSKKKLRELEQLGQKIIKQVASSEIVYSG